MMIAMSTVTIGTRRAKQEDAAHIAQVHDAAWQNAYAGIVPHKALARMIQRRGETWWSNAIRRATLVQVIEMNRRIVGYATIGRNRVEALPLQGEVYELYLAPEYQGIGLGKQLFAAARGELRRRGLAGAVVWVLADNDRAIRFYEREGGRALADGNEYFDGQRLLKVAYAWQ